MDDRGSARAILRDINAVIYKYAQICIDDAALVGMMRDIDRVVYTHGGRGMEVKDEKFVLQYCVRGWWHDFYSYSSEADAQKAADRTQEISRYDRRIAIRCVTDKILCTYDAKKEEEKA